MPAPPRGFGAVRAVLRCMKTEHSHTTARESPVFRVAHVSIRDFAFVPGNIQIAPGETIIWTNYDIAQHTVTFRDGTADSGVLTEREIFSHAFEAPGTFEYYCRLHPSMTGTVMVS